MLNCKDFPDLLSPIERNSWRSLNDIIEHFLGNRKAENYEEIVRNLVRNFGEMGVNMSLKILILDSHLDFCPDNLGNLSDEHGERFHQDLATIENRFRGKTPVECLPNIVGRYVAIRILHTSDRTNVLIFLHIILYN